MQSLPRASLVLALAGRAAGQASDNPMAKVLQLLDDLSAKLNNDGAKEQKAYQEYFEWCDDTAKNTGFAIKTADTAKAKLEAKIEKLGSDISAAGAQVEELAGSIATDNKDLEEATLIRKKELSEFHTGQTELVETIDMVGRAIDILSKEMAKNPAAFAQIDTKDGANILKALSVVLDAASFSNNDQTKLAAFVQSQAAAEATEDDEDMELNAPAAAGYKSQSSGIVDTLEDLKDKAEQQLSELRKAEVNRKHNFDTLKMSLEDQISADTKTMEDEKALKSSAGEGQATAQGDLEVTSKELKDSSHQLESTQQACMQVAGDHEATVAARKVELGVIAQARKVLQESSGGAVSQSYSLLQVQAQSTGPRVVAMVRRLAKKQHSSALAQLAGQIASAMKLKSSGGDPFAKIKGLIRTMIAKLEKEAGADAAEKAYCDEQMAKTAAKKDELEEDVAKQRSRIDQAMTRSAGLRGEIKTLENELAGLAKEQAQLDSIRHEQHTAYEIAKSDLEAGLSGVRQAINLLTQYYSAGTSMLQDDDNDDKFGAFMQQPSPPETHSKSSGAGEGIINILQICESDFADNLAKEEAEEADASSEHEKITQGNAVTKTTKDQGVKYKTIEAKGQDKIRADYKSDNEATSAELSAVLEYFGKIKARCIAKPEAYGSRKARREAEIKGLKEAMAILRDETALLQRKGHGSFRGTLSASA